MVEENAPIDRSVLENVALRASEHWAVEDWAYAPDGFSPRKLKIYPDIEVYQGDVDEARLDVRWYENGDYTFHYTETGGGEIWECRWDRHPKTGSRREHFHPPPDAGNPPKTSRIGGDHHLEVLFHVLDYLAQKRLG